VFTSPSLPSDPDSVTPGVATLYSGFNDPSIGGKPSLKVNGSIVALDGWIIASNLIQGTKIYATNPGTSTSAANVRYNPSGDQQFLQITSLSKFKIDQKVITLEEVNRLLDLTPKSWYDRAEVEDNADSTEGLRRVVGLVAEDVEELAPALATYDGDGELNGVAYDRVAALLIPIIRDQQERILDLEARLGRLEP
jgi:hypothetical protein